MFLEGDRKLQAKLVLQSKLLVSSSLHWRIVSVFHGERQWGQGVLLKAVMHLLILT